jgi:hypothetical protein
MKRRQFMKSLAAPAVFGFPMIVPRRVLGAGLTAPSDRITFASIGVGSQGTGNLRTWLNKDDVRVVAVCDVRKEYRQRAKDAVDTRYGDSNCKGYNDFRDYWPAKTSTP